MRRMQIEGVEMTLDDNGDWQCEDDELAAMLNRMAEDIYVHQCGPAAGNPKAIIFHETARRLGAEIVEDAVEVEDDEDDGRVY